MPELEVREVSYDYEVELPTGLWYLGYRTLQLRTTVRARGFVDERDRFLVRTVLATLSHEVSPEDWKKPETPASGVQRA